MIGDSTAWPFGKTNALLAITVGGSIAGVVTLLHACIQLGWNIPLTIAEGLIGAKAEHGGVGTYVLGVFLHFFIALTAAAVYYAASSKLAFLKQHPLVCVAGTRKAAVARIW